MRQLIGILLFTLTVATASGQTLFFDGLKNSTWTSDQAFLQKEIGLARLTVPVSELKTNRIIWRFGEELTVSHYNVATGKDSILATYTYIGNSDKGLLTISSASGTAFNYKAGITSTGNNVLLYRKRK